MRASESKTQQTISFAQKQRNMSNDTDDFDVVIVGCGLSGLTAAHKILKQNPSLKICIVEARGRMGGRLKSVSNREGKEVDVGGSWVGPKQTNIMSLLDEMSVATHPQYLEGVNIHDDGKALHTYTGTIPSISLLSLIDTHFTLRKMEKLVRTIDLNDPKLCPKAQQWDSISLFEFARKNSWTKQAQSLIGVAARLVFGYDADQVSLLYFLFYCATAGGTRPLLDSDGGGQDSRIQGGTVQLLTALKNVVHAKGCSIRFDTTVRSVDYSRVESVKVCCQTARLDINITARRLIFCVPPSCLSRMSFSPCPSPWKLSLWNRSKAGCYIKIIVYYQSPFWRTNGFSGSCVCENSSVSEGRPLVGVFDYCEGGEKMDSCALCCFVCGNTGEEFSALSFPQQRVAVCAHLEKMFGAEASESLVQEMLIMDWLHDPDGSPAFGGENIIVGDM